MHVEPSRQFKPRIHCVLARPAKRSILETLILGMSLLAAPVLICIGLVQIFDPLSASSTGPSITRIFLGILPIIASVLLGTIATLWVSSRMKRRVRRRNALRYSRLSAVAARPDALRRLPHRCLEYQLCGATDSPKVMQRFARTLPPGHVIQCSQKAVPVAPNFVIHDVAFEPIDMDRDSEQMAWLDALSDPEAKAKLDAGTYDPMGIPEREPAHASLNDEAAPTSRGVWPTLKSVLGAITVIVVLFFPWAFLAYFIVQAIRNPSSANSACVIAPFGFVAGLMLLRLFRRQSNYFIPGGICIRITGFLGRTARIVRATPADSSLILEIESQAVKLSTMDGNVFSFVTFANHGTLLSAWFCKARTPTLAQLELLLDPKG